MEKVALRDIISEYSVRNKVNGDYKVYSVTNSHGFIPSEEYFSKEVYSKDLSNYKIVKNGMLAYNPSRINVGSVAVQRAMEQVIVSPLYVVFQVDEKKAMPEYIYYFLQSPVGLAQIAAHTSGSVRDSLKLDALKTIEINLYSLEEQREIINKLQKLQNLIDKQQLVLKKLDDLVKSQFIEMFGDPENNTNDLPIYKLGDLCTVSSSKRIYQDELTTEGVPFLRVSDLNSKIDYDLDSYELFIPETIYNTLVHEKLVPTENDILITARGTLGKCYIVKSEDKFYFQDGMITWLSHLSEEITRIYLTHLFNMNGIKKQIKELQAGSTVAYLSIAMTKKLNIMLPPLNQQNEFARFVEQTDKSKFRIKQSLEKLETCYKALLQKYFG